MAENVNGVLDELCGASHDGKVTVDEMAEAFGHRAIAPFLIVPPLIEMSPIGGIPGVPTFLALLIAIFAGQVVIGRDEPAVPGFIGRRGVDGAKLRDAVSKMRPLAKRLDGWFHGRLSPLTRTPAKRLAMAFVLLLCLVVPPLELIPFASTMPMAAILLFGLALLFRDGLVMLLAFVAGVAAIGGVIWVVS